MCFTPTISFLTFVVELALALWVFSANPKKTLNRVGALTLVVLGLYQLMEFFVCTSSNPLYWGRMAHIAYTFLPALGVHFALALKGAKKKHIWAIYALPAVFVILAALAPAFVNEAFCGKFFVRILYSWSELWYWSYFIYYALFMIIAGVLLIRFIAKENNAKRRKIFILGLVGALALTFPTFILILLLPELGIFFPSILCHFALLFGIAIAYIIWLSGK